MDSCDVPRPSVSVRLLRLRRTSRPSPISPEEVPVSIEVALASCMRAPEWRPLPVTQEVSGPLRPPAQ